MHSVARQKRNATDELKQKLIDTCDRIPQGTINETIDQWQTRLHACVKAKGRHFEHQLCCSHTTSSFHCNRLTTVQYIQEYASLMFWRTMTLDHWPYRRVHSAQIKATMVLLILRNSTLTVWLQET